MPIDFDYAYPQPSAPHLSCQRARLETAFEELSQKKWTPISIPAPPKENLPALYTQATQAVKRKENPYIPAHCLQKKRENLLASLRDGLETKTDPNTEGWRDAPPSIVHTQVGHASPFKSVTPSLPVGSHILTRPRRSQTPKTKTHLRIIEEMRQKAAGLEGSLAGDATLSPGGIAGQEDDGQANDWRPRRGWSSRPRISKEADQRPPSPTSPLVASRPPTAPIPVARKSPVKRPLRGRAEVINELSRPHSGQEERPRFSIAAQTFGLKKRRERERIRQELKERRDAQLKLQAENATELYAEAKGGHGRSAFDHDLYSPSLEASRGSSPGPHRSRPRPAPKEEAYAPFRPPSGTGKYLSHSTFDASMNNGVTMITSLNPSFSGGPDPETNPEFHPDSPPWSRVSSAVNRPTTANLKDVRELMGDDKDDFGWAAPQADAMEGDLFGNDLDPGMGGGVNGLGGLVAPGTSLL